MRVKYKISKGFITQKIDDKTAVFAGEESVLHTLNETGAYIFQGLKLGWDEEKIVKGLMEKFGAKEKQAREDLKSFTELLLKKNILSPE